mmetsp:Transcript_47435/g.121085  ORF Transcript_47435/g.121085 Transcript_47435/m.121085 type:complete len:222 (-) Transcript_47435:1356-2021(-)
MLERGQSHADHAADTVRVACKGCHRRRRLAARSALVTRPAGELKPFQLCCPEDDPRYILQDPLVLLLQEAQHRSAAPRQGIAHPERRPRTVCMCRTRSRVPAGGAAAVGVCSAVGQDEDEGAENVVEADVGAGASLICVAALPCRFSCPRGRAACARGQKQNFQGRSSRILQLLQPALQLPVRLCSLPVLIRDLAQQGISGVRIHAGDLVLGKEVLQGNGG